MKSYYSTFLTVFLAALFILVSGAAAVTIGDINIHGFISQGYLHSTHDMEFLVDDSDKGSFEFNEMALNFSPDLEGDLSIGAQLFAFDLGTIGNDEVKVDWAFGDYAFRDYLGFRAGIMKIPFGLYSETRKIDMVHTSVLLPTSVYPEWFREAFARLKGASIYGTLPGNISYQAQYGDVDIDADGGLAAGLETLLSSMGEMEINESDTNYAYAGKVQWASPFGLTLAGSLYTLHGLKMTAQALSPLNTFDPTAPAGMLTQVNSRIDFEPIENYVLSAEYMFDRLTLAAEYAEYNLEFTVNTTLLGLPDSPPVSEVETTMQGYYGKAAYRVLDNLEIGAYYSELYFDKDDHDGEKFNAAFGAPKYDAWLKDTCLSVRYDFSSNWCAKLEGHLMDGTFMGKTTNDKDWALYAAKLTYSF
ncbi:MAG: hypothetical protein ACLFPD_06660 [Desulfosudaceae bacterium]